VSVQKLKGEEVDGNEVQMRLYFPTPLAKGKGAKPRFVPGSSLPHLRSCRLTIHVLDRDAVLVCFDCTSDSSFASAAACLDALAGRDCVKVLVATKMDLAAARTVDSNTAQVRTRGTWPHDYRAQSID
jgi:hypothetical protein